MTASTFATATAWSYGLTLAGYAVFALRVAIGRRKAMRAYLLLLALFATGLWAALCLAVGLDPNPATVLAVRIADALRYGAWFLFMWHLLAVPDGTPPALRPATRNAFIAVGAVLVLSVLTGDGFATQRWPDLGSLRVGFIVRLGLAILGLLLAEQVVRRVHPQMRWTIKPLALAMGGVFGLELFFYADAMLIGHLDADVWIARGFANFLVIPLLAIATVRNTGWTVDLHLSRNAVFHSWALLISGTFLLLVAAAGYFVRYFGGDWGQALQVELLFAAALLAGMVVSSGRFRAKLRVFVSKHFFSYRYDYREEWLRFTRTVSTESTVNGVQARTIMALADLVESPGGALWLKNAERRFVQAARLNVPASDAVEAVDGPFAAFLARTGWVIDLDQYARSPSLYPELVVPDWIRSFPSAWLIVPLAFASELGGFVLLATPRTPVSVNWEVRDLLKTASRQAASYLGHVQAIEALLEVRKFDAFNRMSAFVVHDLKNLVAQLSLLLKNARRHRDNPEFQADMLATVEHVVNRMNALMLQLRTGASPVESPAHVDVDAVVRRVCAAKSALRVPIEVQSEGPLAALGHDDRLEHVIGHLVQNAIDASVPGGPPISVRTESDDRMATIVVTDRGIGMTPEYVRDRLFKPFHTTKPAGMGIGVYESAQYVATLHGEIRIESEPGKGTCVRLRLPRAAGTDASAPVATSALGTPSLQDTGAATAAALAKEQAA